MLNLLVFIGNVHNLNRFCEFVNILCLHFQAQLRSSMILDQNNDRVPELTSSLRAVRHLSRALKSPLPRTLRSSKLALMSSEVRGSEAQLSDQHVNKGDDHGRDCWTYDFSSSVAKAILFTAPSMIIGSEAWINSATPICLKRV